tara:strand:- start:17226 stop:18113 length:888 start_codon:yes stop_codon:yes gene_type:complete
MTAKEIRRSRRSGAYRGRNTSSAPLVTDAMTKWSKWLAGIGRSGRTVETSIGNVMRFISEASLSTKRVDKITELDINKYINDPGDSRKYSTRKVILSSIRSLFYYCVAEGWVKRDPSMLVEVNLNALTHAQKEIVPRGTFSVEEYKKVYAKADGFWKFAIALGRNAGLRLSDIAMLEWGSIAEPGLVTVWTRKGRRRVQVPINATLTKLLGKIPKDDGRWCFPEQAEIMQSVKRRALLSVQFKRLCESCGVEGRVFHELRHTYASDMAKKGKTLPHIANMLGHVNLHTTQGYTDH